jgi:hypothetical protein
LLKRKLRKLIKCARGRILPLSELRDIRKIASKTPAALNARPNKKRTCVQLRVLILNDGSKLDFPLGHHRWQSKSLVASKLIPIQLSCTLILSFIYVAHTTFWVRAGAFARALTKSVRCIFIMDKLPTENILSGNYKSGKR